MAGLEAAVLSGGGGQAWWAGPHMVGVALDLVGVALALGAGP